MVETIMDIYLSAHSWFRIIFDGGIFIHVAPICFLVESTILYIAVAKKGDVSTEKIKKQKKYFWIFTIAKVGFYLLLLGEYLEYSKLFMIGRASAIIPLYYFYTLLLVLVYGYYAFDKYLATKSSKSRKAKGSDSDGDGKIH